MLDDFEFRASLGCTARLQINKQTNKRIEGEAYSKCLAEPTFFEIHAHMHRARSGCRINHKCRH